MSNFLKRFFNKNKCNHRWETIDTYTVRTYQEITSNGNATGNMPVQNRIIYVQKCSICGELKHYTINLGD